MGAGTRVSNHGLIAGHAYSVLGAQELKDSAGKVVHKLVRMRNPWGSEEYHGDWSDKSTLWTADFKQQAHYEDKDDGIFFVPLDQWRQDWASISVCHYQDWNETSLEGSPATFVEGGQHSAWLSVELTEDQDAMFECTQTQSRLFPPGCKGDNIPQDYAFLLYDMQLSQLHTRPGMANCNGDAVHISGMKKGRYQVRVINFDGSAEGHKQVWKMRAFGDKSAIALGTQDGMKYVYPS